MRKWLSDNFTALAFLAIAAVHGFWLKDTYAMILFVICSQLADIRRNMK